MAYVSVCLPLHGYASEVWNSHLRYLVADMESINQKAFRQACYFQKYEDITSAMKNSNWPTLEDRRQIKDCCTHDKILNQDFRVNYKFFTLVIANHNRRSAYDAGY